MQLIRGRWSKQYINSWEDKRNFDIMRRGYMQSHETIAADYCTKFTPPELTEAEKQDISQYWSQYGIKIYDYSWHRMYYHATGNHDPRFVPDLVAGLVLYEYYNDHVYENTWRDKNMFHRLLPEIPLPKALGQRIRGRYFHEELGYFSDDDVSAMKNYLHKLWLSLPESGDIVIKESRTSGFGRSVCKYHVSHEDELANILEQWQQSRDYIIQACVQPHPVMAALNPASSNMIRICSWRHGNEVEILFAAARVGAENSFTDISFSQGEKRVNLVGISSDGVFATRMLNQHGHHVRDLPEGIKVPFWDSIVGIIQKNHLLIDNFDIIGWDFTIDANGNPVCFEWNIQWPGTVLYQLANGAPLYGDNTEKIFSFLKEQKNQDNYIPFYMRA